jgi:hypothetical protein
LPLPVIILELCYPNNPLDGDPFASNNLLHLFRVDLYLFINR